MRLSRNQSATVAGYTVTYLGSERTRSAQKQTVKARVRVEHDGSDLGIYAPAISIFPNTTDGIGTPSVRTGLVRDVYLTLVSSPNERGRVTIGVAINPMVVWLWIGGGVIALGVAIALIPTLRRRVVVPVVAEEAPAGAEPAAPRESGPPREPEPVGA